MTGCKRNPGPVLLPILGRKPDNTEPGIPIDVSRASIFDTSYVHPILRRNDTLLWEYYNIYIKVLLWLCSGTTAGMDQWVGEISPERHHPSKSSHFNHAPIVIEILLTLFIVFFNKSMKVCPYISQPYRPQLPGPRLWLYALRSALLQMPMPDTEGQCVHLAPWPKQFHQSGLVEFVDNGRIEYRRMRDQHIRPDIVVLCTGYRQEFPFLVGQSDPPYPKPAASNVRQIWDNSEPSISFIGFVRPSLGAIPPLAEMQAQLWITHLLARHKIPSPLRQEDEPHYQLRSVPGARIKYGVDHETYTYQLALDIDAAPGLADVVSHGSLKLLLIWALGANFNTKFRLRGPWKWEGAAVLLVSDEFWATIRRRPIIFGVYMDSRPFNGNHTNLLSGHFATSILPISIFGPVNLLCLLFGWIFPVFS